MSGAYLKYILLILAVIIISGCQTLATRSNTSYHVYVDSLSQNTSTTHKSYILIPGNKGISKNDLQYIEFSTYVNNALTKKGYTVAKDVDSADLAIFLSYGIGNPQEHQSSYSLPVFGQTGVTSSTTFGTVNSYGNFASYSGTTTYNPTYGITGYRTGTTSHTSYFRFLLIDAWDLEVYRKDKKEIQTWKTTITSTGSSGDLRRVLPVLVGASDQYIGTNTGKRIKVVLGENDPRVINIKGLKNK